MEGGEVIQTASFELIKMSRDRGEGEEEEKRIRKKENGRKSKVEEGEQERRE